MLIFAFTVALHRPVLEAFLFARARAVGLTPELLPANISVAQMDVLENKLVALGSKQGPAAAIPKGPLPTQAKMRSVQRTAKRR